MCLVGAAAMAGDAGAAQQLDWWRTPGAAVVESHDVPQGAICSLFLYNRNAAAVVTWASNDSTDISFYNDDWHFVPNQQLSVAVRVGSAWLGEGAANDPAPLTATTAADHFSVVVQQPLELLLRNANKVTAKLADREMSVSVVPERMPKLLHAVHRCRAAIKREAE